MATIKTSKGARRLSAPKKTVKTKTRIVYREKDCDKPHGGELSVSFNNLKPGIGPKYKFAIISNDPYFDGTDNNTSVGWLLIRLEDFAFASIEFAWGDFSTIKAELFESFKDISTEDLDSALLEDSISFIPFASHGLTVTTDEKGFLATGTEIDCTKGVWVEELTKNGEVLVDAPDTDIISEILPEVTANETYVAPEGKAVKRVNVNYKALVLYAWEYVNEVLYSLSEIPASSNVFHVPYRHQNLELLDPGSYSYDVNSNTFDYNGSTYIRNPNLDLS